MSKIDHFVSGGRGRDLPDRYGNDHTVKTRYDRWIEVRVLEQVFATLAKETDLEWVSVASASIRAHAQAAKARRNRGAKKPKVLAVHAAT